VANGRIGELLEVAVKRHLKQLDLAAERPDKVCERREEQRACAHL